ncbi:protein-disulfide reductase DsbD domain-containing protein [Tabrizicola sp.]|uniref:protein-disulfide reductase DsbD domain-containing protein n=1 Tax=Tabrizicola sp. TaxID=2005166 RepID=UPI00286B510E|nr:protein-disulfide reductase DsbD domain-containing protein [Tabrizicola sp.]
MIRTCILLAALHAVPAIASTQDDVLAGSFLSGWQMPNGAHMAGLQLNLAPGWKTYWRSPGDAGIPPSFDWSGSTNVRSIEIHWPAPTVFHTNGMQSIGYHDAVILPIEVTAIDPTKPMHLAAQIDLGVCDKICLPASLSLSTDLLPPGAPDALISAALDQRPATASEAGVSAVACVVDPIADGLRVTATISLPDRGGDEVVAFETADPSVWVAESLEGRKGKSLIAVTEMVDHSGVPFALDRSAITITVLSNDQAVEIRGCPAP